MENLKISSDALFILLGAIMVLAMHAGFAFFFLLTFAAAIPAIVSGGIAERAKFSTQLAATFLLVGFIYPFADGNGRRDHWRVDRRSQRSGLCP